MKLPTQLPAGVCWLMLPDDAPAVQANLPDAKLWRHKQTADLPFDMHSTGAIENGAAAVRLLGEDLNDLADAEWCAAIDPVTLAADMRDVRIQVWPQLRLQEADAASLIGTIEALLRDDADARLRELKIVQGAPSRWYLLGEAVAGLDFVTTPPAQLRGEPLRHHKPTGTDGRLIHRLSTEIQMSLHQHPINSARESAGLPVVNAVWLWGGGSLPTTAKTALPVLFSNDAYWKGCWRLIATDPEVQALDLARELPDRCVVAAGPGEAAQVMSGVFSSPNIHRVYIASRDGIELYERRGWLGRLLATVGSGQ